MMVSSFNFGKRNRVLGLAAVLVSLALIGASCSAPQEARDYMPSPRQIKGDYIRQGETTEFEFDNPPLSVLKRDYVTARDYPDDFQFYLMVQMYEDADAAALQYFAMVTQLRENTSPGNPIVMDTEHEKLTGVDNTVLMYQVLPTEGGTGRTFVEVWRVFRLDNLVVICESIGYLDPFDPEPGLQKRIDETLYYAELIRDKIE